MAKVKKSRLITIEGVDGAGKSTQISFIYDYLKSKGIDLMLTREPGGVELSEKIRDLLLDNKVKSMHKDTELLLMFAARNEHIQNKIIPTLAKGSWVLSDRFIDSSYAYQGGGRGINTRRISKLDDWVMQGFVADITLLFDIPVKKSMHRIKSKKEKSRIEFEELDFFNRVRNSYIKRFKKFPQRIKLIDASQTVVQISQRIKIILNESGFL